MELRPEKNDRLDRILRKQTVSPWMSRQAWEEALSSGWVRVNGRAEKKGGKQVNPSDLIELDLPSPLGLLSNPERKPRLVWRSPDLGLGVFYKDPGLATHPLFPWEKDTFANGLAAWAEENRCEFSSLADPPSLEGGLLQRLDQHTSGLIASAFSLEAKERYRPVFSGSVHKTYWAIAESGPHEDETYSLFYPGSSSAKVQARVEKKEGDQEAHLALRVLTRGQGGRALLEVQTSHGYRHVVRAGLAALGFPLVGDQLYGGSGAAPFYQLHAYSLQIPGFEAVCASAPESFLDCLARLGLHYSR